MDRLNTFERRARVCAFVGAVAILLLPPSPAMACLLIAKRPIAVSGEEVLVVWNPQTKREELIRYIDFRGQATDFGFIVPTPSEPSVRALRSRAVFDTLSGYYLRGLGSKGAIGGLRSRGTTGEGDAGVRVVSKVELPTAGQVASVLSAEDAGALEKWLARHGYAAGPAVKAYVRPYVERGFFFVAFRYVKGEEERARSSVVALTFETDEPFFPYAEPRRGQRARPFRLTVLSPEPMTVTLGAQRWSARVGFRGALDSRGKYEIITLTDSELPGDRWTLTTFDEPNSRRGRSDLRLKVAPEAPDVAGRLETIIGARPEYSAR